MNSVICTDSINPYMYRRSSIQKYRISSSQIAISNNKHHFNFLPHTKCQNLSFRKVDIRDTRKQSFHDGLNGCQHEIYRYHSQSQITDTGKGYMRLVYEISMINNNEIIGI